MRQWHGVKSTVPTNIARQTIAALDPHVQHQGETAPRDVYVNGIIRD